MGNGLLLTIVIIPVPNRQLPVISFQMIFSFTDYLQLKIKKNSFRLDSKH